MNTPAPTPLQAPAHPAPIITLTPLRPAVLLGIPQQLPVLLRVQAPPAPAAHAAQTLVQAPPRHLALVIDRSGSMSGAPLDEAVRCARHIVDLLQPHDRVAIIVFDDDVDVLLPLGTATAAHRALAHQRLGAVVSGGSTNLHGGWVQGAALLAQALGAPMDAAAPALSRVLLLSDGNVNVGVRDHDTIAADVGHYAAQGVTSSTYGLGNAFNEDLMVRMAQLGLGNHYYGATADDLFEPFAEEFDLISQLCARHLHVSMGTAMPADTACSAAAFGHGAPTARAVTLTLLNDYATEHRDGYSRVRLPDLPWGAEAWAMLRVDVPAAATQGLAIGDTICLVQAGATAVGLDGRPLAITDTQLSLPVLGPVAWESLLEDATVAERHAELRVAAILREARHRAANGDMAGTRALLNDALARYGQHPWSARVLARVRELIESRELERFAKEALYASRKMNSRLTAVMENTNPADDHTHEMPSFLRRKDLQGVGRRRDT